MTMVRKAVRSHQTQQQQQHKILIVQDGYVTLSHNHSDTGEAIPVIASLLLDPNTKRAFIAGINLYETMAYLNTLMSDVPGWRMRFTNRRRYAFTKDGRKVVTGKFFADYFGIDQKIGANGTRLPRTRFEVLNLDLLRDKPPADSESQLDMVLALLTMCEHRGIAMRGTRGSIGNALIKASKHWEPGRKPAPKFINDIARKHLPGNFYALSDKVTDRMNFDHCYYIDQNSAHHNIARSIQIPHPEHIHARGNYRTLKGRWIDYRSPIAQQFIQGVHSGLFLCKLHIATIPPTQRHLYPPWALKRGDRVVWLWSPELRLLADKRIQLDYFIASFTATAPDMVISEYARWALDEINSDREGAKYKKGSLLAAYGMLAFNSAGRKVYRYWGGNTNKPKCEIPRAGLVAESVINIPSSVQVSTINVAARGMIEAETRMRSIEYAKELSSLGFHVPQIYADGLLVETDSLPFIPDGWRVSHSLTNVHIPRPNALVADQLVKLPGIPSSPEDREWERYRGESHARLVTQGYSLKPAERAVSL